MAKEVKSKRLSFTVTCKEAEMLKVLDEKISTSRAEFFRQVVIKEAKKIISKK